MHFTIAHMDTMSTLEQFLRALHSSEQVPVLLHSIETSASDAHPTGHILCHALRSSWSSLLSESDSSLGCCRETGSSATPVKDDNLSSIFWAQVALDYSWEQLHTGHWKDVKTFWKEAYAFAAFLKGLNLFFMGRVSESLVEVDKGILMGAPIMNKSLHTVAAMASKELENIAASKELENGRGVASVREDLASMLDTEDASYAVARREGAAPPSKIGKVKFRNYTPNSNPQKKMKVSASSNIPQARTLSNTPLIDMERRVPVVHCPSLEEFHERHMMSSVPVVVSGVMDHWPAYNEKKWK